MKQIYLALSAVFVTSSLFGQYVPESPTTWKIKKVSISMGVDQDMVNNLDQPYLASTARNEELSDLQGREFDSKDFYGGVCESHLQYLPV